MQYLVRGHQGLRIGRITLIGQQEHIGLDARLLDGVWLRSGIALLSHIAVDQELLDAEGIGALLGVGESVLVLEPGPERGLARLTDEQRARFQVRHRLDVGMRDQGCRVFLEGGADGDHRQALFDRLDRLQVVAHDHVGAAREQQLHHVHLGPAHAHLHVQAVAPVDALGQRLIEAAVLGLGIPVGDENEFFGSLGAGRHRSDDAQHQRGDKTRPARRERGIHDGPFGVINRHDADMAGATQAARVLSCQRRSVSHASRLAAANSATPVAVMSTSAANRRGMLS